MDKIKGLLGLLLLTVFQTAYSQTQDTLTLSRQQAEDRFLKENILLIAEQLKIEQAEALTLQAKLWPNPSLDIDEINLGTTVNGLNGMGYFGEGLPPMWGNFGRNQQIGISLEQLVLTAGKRKKLVALEKVNESMAAEYFKDLLRGLKLEFRNSLSELQYLQRSRGLYRTQLTSLQQLSAAYKNQVELGNVAKGQYIRLKAAELELSKQINELEDELHQEQKELKILMNLPATVYLVLTDEGYDRDLKQFDSLRVEELTDLAATKRADYRMAELELDYSEKSLRLQRAERVPDLTFKAGYDRGGNFLTDFFGVGVAMDLPFFNRNQGNIKHAKLAITQAELLKQYKGKEVENEIILAWQNLGNSIALSRQIEPDYEETLDTLFGGYVKNFRDRDIDMLAFLDFMEAYLENKNIILENMLDIQRKGEEFNYAVGTDLFK